MFPSIGNVKILLCRQPTDMRKSYDTLAALATSELEENPLSGALFVFLNRPRNRIKILYYESGGYCLWMKRLEAGSFPLPPSDGKKHMPLYRQEQKYLRQNIRLPANTMCDWVNNCAGAVKPLHRKLRKFILAHDYLNVDDTPIDLLRKGKKKRQSRLWAVRTNLSCVRNAPSESLTVFSKNLTVPTLCRNRLWVKP